ncbi:MAG: carboxypeptidase regulatory-like domain-containing protein [Bryobacterales bacterium]|nr:carboxypeptidase regulatory-like domain-containing protein [Bryobacterales bacterium]
MRLPRLSVLALVSCAALGQDAPAALTIAGSVQETGTVRPVDDAEVLLFRMPPPGTPITGVTFAAEAAVQSVRTDALGAFRFVLDREGAYRLQARKDGYVGGAPLMAGVASTAEVSVRRGQPLPEIRLAIGRPAGIAGRIEDDATRTGVAGLDVFAYRVLYVRERRIKMPLGQVATSADGAFAFRNLAPGEYMAGIRSRPWGPQRIVKEFAEEDAATVEEGYQEVFWPGGSDLASGYPIVLESGAQADLGPLRVRKTTLHRARVSMVEGNCTEDGRVRIAIADVRTELYETVAETACGRDFLVRGVPPGSYRMQVETVGGSPDGRLSGELDFEIVDKNVALSIALVKGADIEVAVLPASGTVRPDMAKMTVRLVSTGTRPRMEELHAHRPDAEGRFRISNARIQETRIEVGGLPESHYVQEIRYNGAPASRRVVLFNASALSHRLEIVVADKAAAVAGLVVSRDQPVAKPFAILVPWPLESPSSLWPLTTTSGDENGRFRLAGLPPGEYRILAIAPALKHRIEEPNLLRRLLPSAAKAVLSPGGIQSLTLEMNEIR